LGPARAKVSALVTAPDWVAGWAELKAAGWGRGWGLGSGRLKEAR